ncbi:hypothetical protein D3C87_1545340 [compost metagenome]
MLGSARQIELDLVDRAHAGRNDEAKFCRDRLDRPALQAERYEDDDEGDIEEEFAVFDAA